MELSRGSSWPVVLVSGETESVRASDSNGAALLRAGGAPDPRCEPPIFRRVRLVEVSATVAAHYGRLVRSAGGWSFSEGMDGVTGTEVGDGFYAGADAALRQAAEQMRSQFPDHSAAVIKALNSFAAGRHGVWRCSRFLLDLGLRPLVMGIVNVTPDSFSDGGGLLDEGRAEEVVRTMVEDGADIIDIGGESTRPGAEPVTAVEQIRRVTPLLKRLCGSLSCPVSIDTSSAVVARHAFDLGAAILNDVTALTADPEMMPLVAGTEVGVVLMHMQGSPATMQIRPRYNDLVRDIYLFLCERVGQCASAGVSTDRLAIDPGLGFGKSCEHNLELLERVREFTSAGLPVVVGPSRKGFLGKILDLPVNDRVEGTLAAAAAASLGGASVLRVHDVKAVARALRVAAAIHPESRSAPAAQGLHVHA